LRRRCVRSFSHLKVMQIMLVLNIYHYTLKPTRLPLAANCGSLRQSPELCIFHVLQGERLRMVELVLRGPYESYNRDFSPVLELFMRSRECGKSKQLSSSYSRPGYSGSRCSFRWESDLQGLKALLNMHEEPSMIVDDHKGVLGL
jgi:hypothetical protein